MVLPRPGSLPDGEGKGASSAGNGEGAAGGFQLRFAALLPVPVLVLVLVLAASLLAPLDGRAGSHLFVSLDGEDRILVFRRNAGTGALADPIPVRTPGSPGALWFDAKRGVLFAALRSTERLCSFQFDDATRALTLLSEVKVAPDPAYVSLDHSGRWLFSAYYVAGKVAVHAVDAAGGIAREGTWTPTADKAHAALTDPTNRWLVIPHTGPNAVHVFAFAAGTGKLTLAEPPIYRTADGTGPRHAVFHPKLPVLYTVNEQGGSVTTWRVDAAMGTLASIDTLSTLPPDFTGANACADLELTPDTQWLIASNRGHDSLACFRVDPVTGRLGAATQTSTEKTPRQFSLAPDGRFLYAAGQGSGRIATFRMDGKTGALRRIATTEAGVRPWWVLAVDH